MKGKNYNKPKTREKRWPSRQQSLIYIYIIKLEQALLYSISWRGFPFFILLHYFNVLTIVISI